VTTTATKTVYGQRFLRGQVFFADMTEVPFDTGLIAKSRPVLIISNDHNNSESDVITVLPVTSGKMFVGSNIGSYKFEYEDKARYVLCNQIRTIPKNLIRSYMFTMYDDVMQEITELMLETLGNVVMKPIKRTIEYTEPKRIETTPAKQIETIIPKVVSLNLVSKEPVPVDAKIDGRVAKGFIKNLYKRWSLMEKSMFVYDYETMPRFKFLDKYDIQDWGIGSVRTAVYKLRREVKDAEEAQKIIPFNDNQFIIDYHQMGREQLKVAYHMGNEQIESLYKQIIEQEENKKK
jgi:mRNA-degrading endonuclease toxin of MazEF toxin-antitoxin module